MAIRQTSSFSFYCRPSKADKKGLAPVELSIVINGKRSYLKLQRKERPDEFKASMESKKDNPIKTFCENERILVNDFMDQMAFEGIPLTVENLKACLQNGCVAQKYSLGDMWRDLLENKRAELSNGDIDDVTMNKYNLAKDAFYEALELNPASPAAEVDVQHIHRFQSFLRSTKKQNTTYNYHVRVKCAFDLAFNRGKIRSNPYASFKMDKGEKGKEIVWLTNEELRILADKTFPTPRLERVRDLFLFQCYSGISFRDMELLEKDDFKINEEGQIYIEKTRVKTGVRFTSVVLEEGRAILDKYDSCLPVLKNQKYNAYLKEVQDLCGLEKSLHSHLGRTTYVCYLYANGVSPEVIAKLVGHTTCRTTLKYYADMDKSTVFEAVRSVESGSVKTSTETTVPESPTAQVEVQAVSVPSAVPVSAPVPSQHVILARVDTKPLFAFIDELENRDLVKHSRSQLSESDLRKYYRTLTKMYQAFQASLTQAVLDDSRFKDSVDPIRSRLMKIESDAKRQVSRTDIREDIRTQFKYVLTLSRNALSALAALA